MIVEDNSLVYCFIVAGLCWLVAQSMKVIIESISERKVNFSRLFGDGGFPSCHTAFVTGALMSIFLKNDIYDFFKFTSESGNQTVMAVLLIIVIRDAMGIRRQVGDAAKSINVVTKFLRENFDEPMFEIMPFLKKQGHFPHEIIGGVIEAIITSLVVMNLVTAGVNIITLTGFVIVSVIFVILLLSMFYKILDIKRNKRQREE